MLPARVPRSAGLVPLLNALGVPSCASAPSSPSRPPSPRPSPPPCRRTPSRPRRRPTSDPVAQGLAGPLQIDVNQHGIAVAQSARPDHQQDPQQRHGRGPDTEPGDPNSADVAGVLLTKRGVAYTTTNFQQRQVPAALRVEQRQQAHDRRTCPTTSRARTPTRASPTGSTDLEQLCVAVAVRGLRTADLHRHRGLAPLRAREGAGGRLVRRGGRRQRHPLGLALG